MSIEFKMQDRNNGIVNIETIIEQCLSSQENFECIPTENEQKIIDFFKNKKLNNSTNSNRINPDVVNISVLVFDYAFKKGYTIKTNEDVWKWLFLWIEDSENKEEIKPVDVKYSQKIPNIDKIVSILSKEVVELFRSADTVSKRRILFDAHKENIFKAIEATSKKAVAELLKYETLKKIQIPETPTPDNSTN